MNFPARFPAVSEAPRLNAHEPARIRRVSTLGWKALRPRLTEREEKCCARVVGRIFQVKRVARVIRFRVVRHGLQANWNEMNRKMKKRNELVGRSVV